MCEFLLFLCLVFWTDFTSRRTFVRLRVQFVQSVRFFFRLRIRIFLKKHIDILNQSVYNNKSRLNIVCTISSVGRAPDS